jgi:type IV pilus assembly protein PilW
MKTLSTSNPRHQSGFSLIELMIAMVLSLVILLAVVQVFLGSRQTYVLADDMSRVQENGRFSMDFIAQNIRMGGYQGSKGDSLQAFLTTACEEFAPCTDNGAGTGSDRFAVWLNPPPDDGTDTDCTGAAVGDDDVIANVYYITSDADTGINSLTCRGFNTNTNTWNAAEQPLIDGIDNMQVLYGVDNPDPANPDATDTGLNQYVNANQVADWSVVKAVRVALLVSAGTENGSGEEMTRNYVLLDAPQQAITDSHVRQIYTTTITLNNNIGTGI